MPVFLPLVSGLSSAQERVHKEFGKRKAEENEDKSKSIAKGDENQPKKTITDSTGYTRSFMSEQGLSTDDCLFLHEEHLCLTSVSEDGKTFSPFIDTACPTTVAGKEFIKKLLQAYPQEL